MSSVDSDGDIYPHHFWVALGSIQKLYKDVSTSLASNLFERQFQSDFIHRMNQLCAIINELDYDEDNWLQEFAPLVQEAYDARRCPDADAVRQTLHNFSNDGFKLRTASPATGMARGTADLRESATARISNKPHPHRSSNRADMVAGTKGTTTQRATGAVHASKAPRSVRPQHRAEDARMDDKVGSAGMRPSSTARLPEPRMIALSTAGGLDNNTRETVSGTLGLKNEDGGYHEEMTLINDVDDFDFDVSANKATNKPRCDRCRRLDQRCTRSLKERRKSCDACWVRKQRCSTESSWGAALLGEVRALAEIIQHSHRETLETMSKNQDQMMKLIVGCLQPTEQRHETCELAVDQRSVTPPLRRRHAPSSSSFGVLETSVARDGRNTMTNETGPGFVSEAATATSTNIPKQMGDPDETKTTNEEKFADNLVVSSAFVLALNDGDSTLSPLSSEPSSRSASPLGVSDGWTQSNIRGVGGRLLRSSTYKEPGGTGTTGKQVGLDSNRKSKNKREADHSGGYENQKKLKSRA